MARAFEIKLEAILDQAIEVRFYSKHKIDLHLFQIKAFFEPRKSDDYSVACVGVYLDNNAEVRSFSFPKLCKEYSSLNFIVKDKTNRMQFAVRVPLDDSEVMYTPMVY